MREIWNLTVALIKQFGDPDDLRAPNDKNYFYHDLFHANRVEEAEKYALEYTKKKLARLKRKPGERIDAHIMAAPVRQNEHGLILDGTRMLRNKFVFCDIDALMKEGLDPKEVFVEGYGPEPARKISEGYGPQAVAEP